MIRNTLNKFIDDFLSHDPSRTNSERNRNHNDYTPPSRFYDYLEEEHDENISNSGIHYYGQQDDANFTNLPIILIKTDISVNPALINTDNVICETFSIAYCELYDDFDAQLNIFDKMEWMYKRLMSQYSVSSANIKTFPYKGESPAVLWSLTCMT